MMKVSTIKNTNLSSFENIFEVGVHQKEYFLNLLDTIEFRGGIPKILYTIEPTEGFKDLMTLANYHYNNQMLWWLLAITNDIHDPFDIQLDYVKVLKKDYLQEVLNAIASSN